MDQRQEKLAQLRKRAETILRQFDAAPNSPIRNMDELIHELNVYQIELEIQLEDLQQSYRTIETVQQRYTNLFDFAPVGYIVTDLQGIILDVNLTASTMLGVERETLKKMAFAEFITSDFQDIYHLYRRAVLRTRQSQACEVQLRRADGSIFHAQLNTELPDQQAETLRTAITNISTIKQVEETLRRSLAHEQELNQLQIRLLAVIAHEFRTPLAAILSSAEMLYRYGDRWTSEQKKERYETIQHFVMYLNEVVQDARSVNTIADLPVLNQETFDVVAFMRQLISDLEATAMQKDGQTIVLEIVSQHDHEEVRWDQNLARRLVMNLLHNALNYSSQPVRCRLECEDTVIHLLVEDQGIGISETDQQHIYEAFYRGQNVELLQGTGIGLYVVQRAVQAHGGTIRCESRPDAGTTFIVDLPRHPGLPPDQ